MTTTDDWIIVPHWGRFQHYGTARRPIWIKNYNALLHKDSYTDLTLGQRGLLHGIWLAYAEAKGQLRKRGLNTRTGTARVPQSSLDALLQAGWIEFSASKPLDLDLKHVHAREDDPEGDSRQHRRAEAWIRNGAAADVPVELLGDYIAGEFKITDPSIVDHLVAQAKEWVR